jgi:hypothetical protein
MRDECSSAIFESSMTDVLSSSRKRVLSFQAFSDLGYIEFQKDQLATEIGSLFQELVGLDILEVRAKV